MKRLSLFAVALAFVAAGCSKSSTSPSTTPTKPTFTATLSTANEVPPITNAESGGRGDATITFDGPRDATGNFTGPVSVTFVVNLSGFPAGTPINIAHIHTGAAGVNGLRSGFDNARGRRGGVGQLDPGPSPRSRRASMRRSRRAL